MIAINITPIKSRISTKFSLTVVRKLAHPESKNIIRKELSTPDFKKAFQELIEIPSFLFLENA